MQTSLARADSAYQKPSDGVPLTDLRQADLDATYAAQSDLPTFLSGTRATSPVERQRVVSLADFVTATGTGPAGNPLYTFNSAAAVAAAEARKGAIFVPPGDWMPNAINVPMDTVIGGSLSGPKQRFNYEVFGAGGSSRIVAPAGMTASDVLWVVNSANANDFAWHPKVNVHDLTFTGCDRPTVDAASQGGMIWCHQRSIDVRRVKVAACRGAFRIDGYTDQCHFEQIYGFAMHSDTAPIIDASGLTGGDGWVLDRVFPYGSYGATIAHSRGLTMKGCISGWYRFQDCDITLHDNHLEGDGTTNSIPQIDLRGTTCRVLSGYHQNRPGRPAFSINDGSTVQGTSLTVEHAVKVVQRLDSPSGNVDGAVLSPFVDIAAANLYTELRLRNVRTQLLPQWSGGSDTPKAFSPVYVTASGVPSIASILTGVVPRVMLGLDVVLRWTNGTWDLAPAGVGTREAAIPLEAIVPDNRPSTTVTAVTNPGFESAPGLAAGTYYYRIWMTNVANFSSAPSPERTVTTAAGQIPQIALDTYCAPVAITILRGTTAGTYTHWARVWVSKESCYLYDQGGYIGGSAWSTTGVPTPPAANAFTEGMLIRRPWGGFRKQVWGTAAPTAGAYSAGDQCLNTAPAAGGVPGWVCVTAGEPGTWKAMSSLAP